MSDRSIEVRRAELAALIEGRSDEEIARGVEERGVEGVLDDVFQGMAEAFLPDKTAGQSAIVQYDVSVAGRPGGDVLAFEDAGEGAEPRAARNLEPALEDRPRREDARLPSRAHPDFCLAAPLPTTPALLGASDGGCRSAVPGFRRRVCHHPPNWRKLGHPTGMTSEGEPSLTIGSIFQGGYEILSRLGAGRFGWVYKAR